nr:rhamnogalacturonan acetylesterase [uncultured Sphaerochaeta sp.]
MTIYLAGDSTCANKTDDVYPETGWGQALPGFLRGDVQVSNHAMNGRSTKSFIDEGRLAEIESRIKPGDWLFIQFGHNDQKPKPDRHTEPFGSYQEKLLEYVRAARDKGAHPLLLTSIYRRHFLGDKLDPDCHGDYPAAVKELGLRENIPVIDMTEITRSWLEEEGDEKSRAYFLIMAPGEYENYPEGKEDNTHLSVKGAQKIASLIAEELKNIPLIGDYVR